MEPLDKTRLAALMKKYPITLLNSGNWRTCPVRLSFPSLFEKTSFEGSEPKYSAVLLFPLGVSVAPLMQAAQKTAFEEWGEKSKKMTLHNPFRDQGMKQLAGYVKGAPFITVSTKQKPGVVGPDMKPIMDPEEIYAGCWVLATIRPFSFDATAKKGVSFGLQNILKIADDEPFSGGPPPEDEFGDVTAEQSGEDAFGLPQSNGSASAYDFG